MKRTARKQKTCDADTENNETREDQRTGQVQSESEGCAFVCSQEEVGNDQIERRRIRAVRRGPTGGGELGGREGEGRLRSTCGGELPSCEDAGQVHESAVTVCVCDRARGREQQANKTEKREARGARRR